MDIEPTVNPSTSHLAGNSNLSPSIQLADGNSPDTLVNLNSNGRQISNTATVDMACNPRRRGRPRKPTNADNPVSAASSPQVALIPENKKTDNGDVEITYRRRGRPRKATIPGNSNINLSTPRPTVLRCENNTRGPEFTSECLHDPSPATPIMNPASISGDVELSYRRRGRPRKATNIENSNNNLTTPRPKVLRCENTTRGPVAESMDNTQTASNPSSRKYLKGWSFGGPTEQCEFCYAVVWKEESVGETSKNGRPKFNICRHKRKVKLPLLKEPPELLKGLLDPAGGTRSTEFRRLIRSYNTIYAFTSMGGRVDNAINKGGAPYCFRLGGQNHHNIGSLLPPQGKQPRFMQLYFHDTKQELSNRVRSLNGEGKNSLKPDIVESLSQMVYDHNEIAKVCKMAKERMENLKLEP